MKIATLNTLDHEGGAAKIASQLVEGYRRRGHESWLIVGRGKSSEDPFRIVLSEHAASKQETHLFRPNLSQCVTLQKSGRELQDFPESHEIANLLPKTFDILHAHNLHGGYFDLRQLPVLGRRVPIVLTLHDAWLLAGHCAHSLECERWRTGCGSCPRLDIYPSLECDGTYENLKQRQEIFKKARAHVATPSQWLMDKVTNSKISPHVVGTKVIPNGFDISTFSPGDKMEARRRLGLPTDIPIILFSANGVKNNIWKDFAAMRQVLARLSGMLSPPPMLLALGEEAEEECVNLARIEYRAYENDEQHIADYYRAADIYLIMSLADTFPNVVAEALCCGLPVAASAVGGIPEQVRSIFPLPSISSASASNPNGVLVSPGDIESMTHHIANLLTNSEMLAYLSHNALSDRAHYDRERMISDYLGWFQEIKQSRDREDRMTSSSAKNDSEWLNVLTSNLISGVPANRVFGLDRGMPIDRWYIERFLSANASDIVGDVLEIGDPTYTKQFGHEETVRSKVLTASKEMPADYRGDIADPATLPDGSFDCLIMVQTLQFIYDIRKALTEVRRSLKPGGILLATFPGITQISRYDMDRWGEFWRLTSKSAGRLFADVFQGDHIEVSTFGNAAATTAFLNGLSVEELPKGILDKWDRDYEMLITVRVVKRRDAQASPGQVLPRFPFEPPIVLMYHRVADLDTDPQCLSVTPKQFEEHMRIINEIGTPISLCDLAENMETGLLPERSIVVTFDDGYEDNLAFAKPILERHSVPATVFMTAGMIGSRQEFWWDELERILLLPGKLPEMFSITINDQETKIDLGDCALLTEDMWLIHKTWTVLHEGDPTPRHRLYRFIHRLMYMVGNSATRGSILNFLRNWSGATSDGRITHRAMSEAMLVDIAKSGLIHVGAHTMTHPVLSQLDHAEQMSEILGSKNCLQEILGDVIRSFAYPYGGSDSFNQETLGILQSAGFQLAVATTPGAVRSAHQLFAIPRLCVRNWTGDEFRKQLKLNIVGGASP
ncbi:MAG: polysaccharide deacetylase family protein [Alphaproteobacteria bacterium]|nr:polysaccharide deacetylase family protein [Alphaproteobacteria bacterium]